MQTAWAAICLLGAVACSSGDDGTAKGNLRGATGTGATNNDRTSRDADIASAGGRANDGDSNTATGGRGSAGEGPNGCGTGGAIGYALRVPQMRVSLGTDWTKIAGGAVRACMNDVCTDFGIPGGPAPPSFATLAPSSSSTSPPDASVVVDFHDEAPELVVTADWSLSGWATADTDTYALVVTNFEHQVIASDRARGTYSVPAVCPCTGACGSATLTELPPAADAGAHDAGDARDARSDF